MGRFKGAGIVARMVWLDLLRRKDLYVLAILTGALLWVLVSLDFFGLEGMSRYVADVGLLLVWLFGWVLACAVSARLLPEEERRRTIFPLLSKPLTREAIIVGKWLGAWGAVGGAVLGFTLLVAFMMAQRGGAPAWNVWMQGLLLHAAALGVLCALGILFSTRLAGDAALTLTCVVSGAAIVLLPRAPEFMLREEGWRATIWLLLYHALPRFELFDVRQRMVHGYGPAPAGAVAGVLLYAVLYTALLLWLAWLSFRRKRFTRGAA